MGQVGLSGSGHTSSFLKGLWHWHWHCDIASFYETLNDLMILKILTENLFRELVPTFCFPKAGWDSGNCPESRQRNVYLRWFFLHPIKGKQGRKLTNSRKGIKNRYFDAVFATSFRISKRFQSNIWYLFFSSSRAALKGKKLSALINKKVLI